MRTFRDESGRLWTTYPVTPETTLFVRAEMLPPNYREGWLVFDSDGERRRFAPCPGGWESFPVAALRLLLQKADRVRTRAPVFDVLGLGPPSRSEGPRA